MAIEDFDVAGNAASETMNAAEVVQPDTAPAVLIVAQDNSEPAPVDAGTGQQLGEGAASSAAPQPVKIAIVGEGNAVHLPEGVSIEKIKIEGRDLVLEQPDGSVVVIKNAALNIPTFWIGDVEIPQIALTAALEANGINVAAGPDGILVAVAGEAQSNGGNFGNPNPGIGDAGPILGLLPPTALAFGRLDEPELFPGLRNDFPDIDVGIIRDGVTLDTDQGRVDESALNTPTSVGSGGGSSTAEGVIDVTPGDDGIASVTIRNSAGVVVDITNGGVIQGVYGSLIITPNGSAGEFHFEYVLSTNTIDHAVAGVTGVADPVFDNFVVTVTDGNGDTASDDFSILIGDDGPVAVSDINSVTEDGPLVATGSVMANDTEGADGASVTGIEAGLATTASGGVGAAVDGSYGTLTLQSNGTYVYALDNDARVQGLSAGEQLTDVFTYTLTDGDGDTSTTTLTITILGADDGVTITGLAVLGGELRVDEDDLANGSSPDPATLTRSGNFTLSAVDGLDTITVAGVTVVSGGVFVGGTITTATGILTITSFTPVISAGEVVGGSVGYSYQLTDNTLAHGPGNNGENGGVFDNFSVVVTDQDGSSATASLDVEIIDDVPDAVGNAGVTAWALLDESNAGLGGDGDGINPAIISAAAIAGLFAAPAFGADGAGTVGYTLSATAGAATGLWLTGQSGAANEIVLVQVSATVFEGRAGGAGGTLAFTISINAATGQVTVTQAATLEHGIDGPEGAAHDDALTLSAAAAIRVVQTVTDGDGDTDTATSVNGLAISFEDDGPNASIQLSAAQIIVDESVGTTGSTQNEPGGVIPNDEDGDTDPFGYGRLIGFTALIAAISSTAAAGADGGAPAIVSLTTAAGGAINGVLTNLIHTATGNQIFLFTDVNGVIVGREGTSVADAATGTVVFAVGLNGSDIEVAQYGAIVHANIASHDDGRSLDNLIFARVSITDGDGDTATAVSASALQIRFEDDGPFIGNFTSGFIANQVGTVNGFFDADFGSDGFHASNTFDITGTVIPGIVYSETDLGGGVTRLLAENSTGTDIFALTVRADGTYTFELITPAAATNQTISLLNLSAGGPTPFLQTADGRIEFTGNGNGVNSSSQGFGVDNQFVGVGEIFTMEFHNPGAPGNQDPTVNPEFFDQLTLTNDNINGSLTITWTAFNDVTMQTESGVIAVTGATTMIDPSISFNRIEFVGSSGSGQGVRFQSVTLGKTILPPDQHLDFTIIGRDGDGDVSTSTTLGIDVRTATGGTFTLNGGAGDDVPAGSTLADTIDGNGGFDYVDYRDSASAVTVNLNTGLGSGGQAAGDTYADIEGILGGSAGDTLIGNILANVIDGGAGSDTMTGNGGADTFVVGIDSLGVGINDLILDYNDAQGDVVDLSALLETLSGAPTTAAEVDAVVNLVAGVGTTSIMVDDNGTAAGGNVTEVATLSGTHTVVAILFDDAQAPTDVA